MKSFLLVLCLCLIPSVALAGDKPPKDYPLTAHVVASHNSVGANIQLLEAVIDGKQVTLFGNAMGVLALGDYKARVSSGSYTQTTPNAYDLRITYEFLFPDGHSRTYRLTGLGFPGPASPQQ